MSIDWAISYLMIYIPYSFYMSVTTMVGSSLGEGDIKKAKHIFKLIFQFCSIIATFICVTAFLFSDKIVEFYDEDPEVVAHASIGL